MKAWHGKEHEEKLATDYIAFFVLCVTIVLLHSFYPKRY